MGALSLDIPIIIDEMVEQSEIVLKQLKKIRKAFYCYICDFDNHQYIDTEAKEITVNE